MAKAVGKGPSKGPAKGKGRGAGPPPRVDATKTLASKTVTSLPKLRPLFWQTVQQVPQDSVWSGVSAPVSFDAHVLEQRFALADARTKTVQRSAGHIPGEESRKKLRVLDDRTSQLLAISFNKLPPAEQLTSVVDTLETFPEGLSAPEAIMALNSAFSEQRDAVEQLRHMELSESDLAQLDLPERYLWVMGHKPLIAAKICSGAVILGLAPELPEWRNACDRVVLACQKLKHSNLVRKCISTCLAVGNVMNRGTTRDGAKAVVLPDGLLKLDELKGRQENEGTGGTSQSLLDFVSEAIVWEAVMQSRSKQKRVELQAEAQDLHDALNAAKGVCLLEAESSCQKIAGASKKAHSSLIQESSEMSDVCAERLKQRVQSIIKEAKETLERVVAAKSELKQQMEWFSAKANITSSDWLSSWVHFLDLLSSAFLRIKLPAELPPVVVPSPVRTELKDVTNSHGTPALKSNGPKVAVSETPTAEMQLDDDERIEVLLAKMAARAPVEAEVPQTTTKHEFKPTATHPPAGRQPVASPQIGTRVPLLYSNRGLGS